MMLCTKKSPKTQYEVPDHDTPQIGGNATDNDSREVSLMKVAISPINSLSPLTSHDFELLMENLMQGNKHESELITEEESNANRSWASEMEKVEAIENKSTERQLKLLQKERERRMCRKQKKKAEKAGKAPEQLTASEDLNTMKLSKHEKDKAKVHIPKKVGKEKSSKSEKTQDSIKPKSRNVGMDSLTKHNVLVAATGLDAYIGLHAGFLEKGTISEWVYAAAVALSSSGRQADLVSYLSAPQKIPGASKGKKPKSAPSLVVHFLTEELLSQALGPITIMGFETEIVKYRGGKSCVFVVTPGTWGAEPERIIQAFEEQAMVKLDCWGWHRVAGVKVDLMLRSEMPPGRNLKSVKIDGWHLSCIRADEQKCHCCGLVHDCFAPDTHCANFTHG